MNVLGTSYFDTYANYQIGYDILSTDKAAGTHTVRFYGVLNVTGTNISWSWGEASVYGNTVGVGTSYGNGSHTLVTKDATFTCDSSGNFSGVAVSGSINTSYKSGSTSGTMNLPHIDRYPVLTSGSDFTDRTNPVYTITAYGAYPIRVKIEAGGNTQLITRDLTSKNSQTYTLVLTKEERKTLKDLSLDGETLIVRETVCAMNGSTELNTSYKDYTMTITSRPLKLRVNGTFVDAIPYVRVNNEWKEADAYVRVNNEWKEGI